MVAWRMQAVVVTVALCIAVIGAVTTEELPNVAVEQDAVQSQTIEDGLAPNKKADAGKHLGAAYGAAMDHLNGMSDKQRKSLATNAALLAVTPMVGPRKLALMYGSYRFRVFLDKYVKQTQENPVNDGEKSIQSLSDDMQASNEGLDSIISRATDQLPKDKVAAQAMMFAAEMALVPQSNRIVMPGFTDRFTVIGCIQLERRARDGDAGPEQSGGSSLAEIRRPCRRQIRQERLQHEVLSRQDAMTATCSEYTQRVSLRRPKVERLG